MLKLCTAFVLLMVILATTFSKAVIIIDFYANQDYIAKNLCENRDKPMMHCHGRCQLCKQLNREANQDKNNPEQRPETRQEVLFLDEFATASVAPAFNFVTLPYGIYSVKDPIDRAAGIFHPPA